MVRLAFERVFLWQVVDRSRWLPTPVRALVHRRWEKAYIAFARSRGDKFYD